MSKVCKAGFPLKPHVCRVAHIVDLYKRFLRIYAKSFYIFANIYLQLGTRIPRCGCAFNAGRRCTPVAASETNASIFAFQSEQCLQAWRAGIRWRCVQIGFNSISFRILGSMSCCFMLIY